MTNWRPTGFAMFFFFWTESLKNHINSPYVSAKNYTVLYYCYYVHRNVYVDFKNEEYSENILPQEHRSDDENLVNGKYATCVFI